MLAPQIEPRLGVTWDLTGAGDTTVLHSSAGCVPPGTPRRRHRSATCAANPPFIHNPIVYYNTLEQRCSRPASTLAEPARAPSKRIGQRRQDAELASTGRSACGASIGWGTAVDATYVRLRRHN